MSLAQSSFVDLLLRSPVAPNSMWTILLLTFISIKPNIQQPRAHHPPASIDRWNRLLTRIRKAFERYRAKLYLCLLALVAPELILGFAMRQSSMVSWLMKQYGLERPTAWFLVMGGFVTAEEHHPIVTQKDIGRYLVEIKTIDPAEITDKSKSSGLAKLLVFLQVGWFAIQFIARASAGLPLLELQIVAIAFFCVQSLTVVFWWEKPQDVRRAIVLGLEDTLPLSSNLRLQTKTELNSSVFDLGHFLTAAIFGTYPKYDPSTSTAVPMFWSHTANETSGSTIPALLWQFCMALVFGGIHGLAWNLIFPSLVEMWMWRAGVVAIVALPVLGLILAVVYSPLGDGPLRTTLVAINHSLAAIYVLARVTLLILPFTTLRQLPANIALHF
ncbi:hypothetical protein C8F01DRAFT_1345626 [Mycena amicta]|nr:hypothetical protein C8F01DRAFT_1345626 [Mycena amicta]